MAAYSRWKRLTTAERIGEQLWEQRAALVKALPSQPEPDEHTPLVVPQAEGFFGACAARGCRYLGPYRETEITARGAKRHCTACARARAHGAKPRADLARRATANCPTDSAPEPTSDPTPSSPHLSTATVSPPPCSNTMTHTLIAAVAHRPLPCGRKTAAGIAEIRAVLLFLHPDRAAISVSTGRPHVMPPPRRVIPTDPATPTLQQGDSRYDGERADREHTQRRQRKRAILR